MRKNINRLSILLVVWALCIVSCTNKFSEYNTNQHEVTDEMTTYDNFAGNFIRSMQRDIIPTSDRDANEYQRAQNLTGDIYSGYLTAINNWNGSSNNTTYNMYFDRWNDVGFDVAYTKVIANWMNVRNYVEGKVPETMAIANILKVASLHRICDNHGPIPYSQIGSGGFSIPYDSQEEVYNQFFKELTDAIVVLSDFVDKTPNARPLKRFDLVYASDYKKWVQFAASLKLRLAMRIVYVKPELAKKYAEEAVKSPYGVITDNTGNALLQSTNGVIVSHPLKVVWDAYNDTRLGASMESILKGYEDPRLEAYFYPSLYEGGYFGGRNGVNIGSSRSDYIKLSCPKIEAGTPLQWMCAAEIYFLRAEGALRGWDMQGTAEELYKEGIRKSFEQYKLEGVDNYLNDNVSKAVPFHDQVGSNSISDGDSRLSTITIKWEADASFEQNLERIITQKWLAMFPDGQEAWSEYRRTAYPKIFPVVVNQSNGTVDTEKQIRRIPFPESEYINNGTEVKKAIKLLEGNDNGGTKVWWDKK